MRTRPSPSCQRSCALTLGPDRVPCRAIDRTRRVRRPAGRRPPPAAADGWGSSRERSPRSRPARAPCGRVAGDHLHERRRGDVGGLSDTRRRSRLAPGNRPSRCAAWPQRSNRIAKCGIVHHHVETRGEEPSRPLGGAAPPSNHGDERHRLNIHSGLDLLRCRDLDSTMFARRRSFLRRPKCCPSAATRTRESSISRRPPAPARPRSSTGSTARTACWPRRCASASKSSTTATPSRPRRKATSSEQLRVLVEAMLHHYDWKLWMELCVLALRDKAAAAERDRMDRRWRAALRAVIRDGQASGEFVASDPDETMFVLGRAARRAVTAAGAEGEGRHEGSCRAGVARRGLTSARPRLRRQPAQANPLSDERTTTEAIDPGRCGGRPAAGTGSASWCTAMRLASLARIASLAGEALSTVVSTCSSMCSAVATSESSSAAMHRGEAVACRFSSCDSSCTVQYR